MGLCLSRLKYGCANAVAVHVCEELRAVHWMECCAAQCCLVLCCMVLGDASACVQHACVVRRTARFVHQCAVCAIHVTGAPLVQRLCAARSMAAWFKGPAIADNQWQSVLLSRSQVPAVKGRDAHLYCC